MDGYFWAKPFPPLEGLIIDGGHEVFDLAEEFVRLEYVDSSHKLLPFDECEDYTDEMRKQDKKKASVTLIADKKKEEQEIRSQKYAKLSARKEKELCVVDKVTQQMKKLEQEYGEELEEEKTTKRKTKKDHNSKTRMTIGRHQTNVTQPSRKRRQLQEQNQNGKDREVDAIWMFHICHGFAFHLGSIHAVQWRKPLWHVTFPRLNILTNFRVTFQ
jgi:hypothetical protein